MNPGSCSGVVEASETQGNKDVKRPRLPDPEREAWRNPLWFFMNVRERLFKDRMLKKKRLVVWDSSREPVVLHVPGFQYTK
ncbi:hypothetical protein RJ640_005042 [Escallonia rubra]|uniref:Uncharacterized protein n=1 Tax=Escallonia rubra TaxID=112253 RepID=A0AA88QLU4_9ASTE|nr:hypothetical protein RJ640_005042 [Escallonia rubra]